MIKTHSSWTLAVAATVGMFALAGCNQRESTNETAKDDTFAKHLQSRPWTLKVLDREQRTITICDKPISGGGLTLIFSADFRCQESEWLRPAGDARRRDA